MSTKKTFNDLLEVSASHDVLKYDALVQGLEWTPDGRLKVRHGQDDRVFFTPEPYALRQLAQRYGAPFWDTSSRSFPSDVFVNLHSRFPDIFRDLATRLDGHYGKGFLVRCYGNMVRAFLSEKYTVIDNTNLLGMAAAVTKGLDGDVIETGKYFSKNDGVQRDGMYVRFLMRHVHVGDQDVGGDGMYRLGFMLRNGETGNAAAEIRPLIMRTRCENSIVLKSTDAGETIGLSFQHRGQVDTKLNLMASAITEVLPMAYQGLDRFLSLQTQDINIQRTIDSLAEKYGWAEEVKMGVAVGTEGKSTPYGLVNGVTFAAQNFDLSPEARWDMESLAGNLVYQYAERRD